MLGVDVDARVLVSRRRCERARDSTRQRRHLALDGVVCVLRAEEVVDDGPRGDWPAVVDLPHQSAGAVLAAGALPLTLPEAVGTREALALHQLCRVDVLLDRVGGVLHVLHEVEGDAALVTVGFVVEVDG